MSILKAKVGEFIGNYKPTEVSSPQLYSHGHSFLGSVMEQANTFMNQIQISSNYMPDYTQSLPMINTRDTKLHYLFAKLTMLRAEKPEEDPDHMNRIHKLSLAISMELQRRMRIDHVFEEFLAKGMCPGPTSDFTDEEIYTESAFEQVNVVPKNFQCLRRLIGVYERFCGEKLIETYDLTYVHYLVQECEKLPVPSAIDALIHRLQKACSH